MLYVVLGFTFLLVLGAVSYAEPVIVQHMVAANANLSFLTKAEASHMNDVAAVVQNGVLFMLIALLFVFFYAQRKPINKSLVRQSLLMSLVFLVLLIPFNYTFTWFHQAFFPQGNWQFPADSWLITHFPPAAFIVLGVWWLGGTAVLLVLLMRTIENKEKI